MRRVARVGTPFVSLPRSLSGVHRRGLSISLSTADVIPHVREKHVSYGVAASEWLRRALKFSPLETRVQPVQALPCAQDLRVQLHYHSSCFPALHTMLISPLGFPARSGGCPRGSLPSTLCPFGAISCAPKRRTNGLSVTHCGAFGKNSKSYSNIGYLKTRDRVCFKPSELL
jgi:hypothetical protein